ncbi:MAG TPA: amino acid racemase [Gemmatimonadaceae bacterium]
MTTVGLVGGLGAESTIDYYRRIISRWRESDQSSYPSIVIDSLDVDIGIRLSATDHAALADYLSASIARLMRAGVDFTAMAANTPHIVFDELAKRSSVPMLSIVEVCADEARARGFKRLLILGTRFTMEGTFYPRTFERRGLEIVAPPETDRDWIHEKYIGELLAGKFLDATRARLVDIISRMRDEHSVDALILGGTELPLLLRTDTIAGLPTLDTTELHVRAIVHRLQSA